MIGRVSDWDLATPDETGWSPDALAEARAASQRIGTASFVVVQHGRIIDSWGDVTRRLQAHSVRKSLLNALIGIAIAEGRISLDATLASLGVNDVAPSLSDAEKQATVRQLMQARSGVYHVANYEDESERRRRPARGSHAPGSFWYYNNWDFNALGTIYERAVGASIFDAFQTRIAEPIGMQDYRPSDGRYVTSAVLPACGLSVSRGAPAISPALACSTCARAAGGAMRSCQPSWVRKARPPRPGRS